MSVFLPHQLELSFRRDERDGSIGVEFPQAHAPMKGAIIQSDGWATIRPPPGLGVALHRYLVVQSEFAVRHSCGIATVKRS